MGTQEPPFGENKARSPTNGPPPLVLASSRPRVSLCLGSPLRLDLGLQPPRSGTASASERRCSRGHGQHTIGSFYLALSTTCSVDIYGKAACLESQSGMLMAFDSPGNTEPRLLLRYNTRLLLQLRSRSARGCTAIGGRKLPREIQKTVLFWRSKWNTNA